jgi:hypothetical protein
LISQSLALGAAHRDCSPLIVINAKPLASVLSEIEFGQVTVNMLAVDVLIDSDSTAPGDKAARKKEGAPAVETGAGQGGNSTQDFVTLHPAYALRNCTARDTIAALSPAHHVHLHAKQPAAACGGFKTLIEKEKGLP